MVADMWKNDILKGKPMLLETIKLLVNKIEKLQANMERKKKLIQKKLKEKYELRKRNRKRKVKCENSVGRLDAAQKEKTTAPIVHNASRRPSMKMPNSPHRRRILENNRNVMSHHGVARHTD